MRSYRQPNPSVPLWVACWYDGLRGCDAVARDEIIRIWFCSEPAEVQIYESLLNLFSVVGFSSFRTGFAATDSSSVSLSRVKRNERKNGNDSY